MQWLIDMAIEAMEQYLADNPRFVDRGDAGAYDWDQTTLTGDNAWHELDVSSVVPADAAAILFNVWFEDGLVSKQFKLRKNGHVGAFNFDEISQSVAATYMQRDMIVAGNPNQKIDYWLASEVDHCYVLVRGWWL